MCSPGSSGLEFLDMPSAVSNAASQFASANRVVVTQGRPLAANPPVVPLVARDVHNVPPMERFGLTVSEALGGHAAEVATRHIDVLEVWSGCFAVGRATVARAT